MYLVENYELLVLFHENSGKQQKHCLKPEPSTKILFVSLSELVNCLVSKVSIFKSKQLRSLLGNLLIGNIIVERPGSTSTNSHLVVVH